MSQTQKIMPEKTPATTPGTTSKSTDRIGTDKISKLLWDFSIPAIIGMLVNATYNIVDRIYVGQGVDPLGIAGITLVMPVMMVIQALSMLIGIGANSLFAIRLGEGRSDEVEKIMGHAFVLIFAIPFVGISLCFAFIDPMLTQVLGASEQVLPYAKTYLQIILYGSVFAAMGPGINHFIRSDGHPRMSMTTQIIGAGCNIILDPIFIFGFGWGIAGAAWATVISQFVSFVWVMWYWNSSLTPLRFRVKYMCLKIPLVVKVLSIGFAPCAMQFALSFINIMMNNELVKYGGDIAVTAVGIMYSILIVVVMAIQGLNSGAQPLIGYNFGAQKYDRVRSCFRLTLVCATMILTFSWALIQLFPAFFIGIFTKDKGELLELSIHCMRTCTIMFPIIGVQIVSSSYFLAVGKPFQSTLISLSRQFLFYLPALATLPRFFGLTGVFSAMPVSDVCAVTLTSIFILAEWKKLKKMETEQEKRVD